MDASFLNRPGRPRLAYIKRDAKAGSTLPALLFCSGFRSDMTGTKAAYLEEQAAARGQGYIRFDYAAHGQSGGAFRDQTLGLWIEDTLAILDTLTAGPVVIVGSSMGGWIALNVALKRKDRITGLVGIAAAPDFTRGILNNLTPDQKAALEKDGVLRAPSDYSDDPYIFTRALLEDGEKHCLLDQPISLDIPVRLVQGMEDNAVPWQTAYRIHNALTHPDRSAVLLVEHGDHRLSRPEDLDLIDRQVRIVCGLEKD